MKYLEYSLGQLRTGDVVEVTLSSQANVRLLDPINLSRFKNGQRHNYFGGLARVSPFRVAVPSSGTWYVVVDLGGYAGRVSASVNVLSRAAM